MQVLSPFICMAPSPVRAMATRSGKQNLAATEYGTAGPMVARLPLPEAIIPRRIFRSRPYQLAAVPESAERMQLSGNFGESSQNTRSGLIGLALFIARASMIFHQSRTHSAILFCHERSRL